MFQNDRAPQVTRNDLHFVVYDVATLEVIHYGFATKAKAMSKLRRTSKWSDSKNRPRILDVTLLSSVQTLLNLRKSYD